MLLHPWVKELAPHFLESETSNVGPRSRYRGHSSKPIMGKANKAFKEFLESIPLSKLTGLPDTPSTIHSDDNYRLDMQGVLTTIAKSNLQQLIEEVQITSKKPKKHNLQIQVNYQTTVSSLKRAAPVTVSTVLVLKHYPPPAEDIIDQLRENYQL